VTININNWRRRENLQSTLTVTIINYYKRPKTLESSNNSFHTTTLQSSNYKNLTEIRHLTTEKKGNSNSNIK